MKRDDQTEQEPAPAADLPRERREEIDLDEDDMRALRRIHAELAARRSGLIDSEGNGILDDRFGFEYVPPHLRRP